MSSLFSFGGEDDAVEENENYERELEKEGDEEEDAPADDNVDARRRLDVDDQIQQPGDDGLSKCSAAPGEKLCICCLAQPVGDVCIEICADLPDEMPCDAAAPAAAAAAPPPAERSKRKRLPSRRSARDASPAADKDVDGDSSGQ